MSNVSIKIHRDDIPIEIKDPITTVLTDEHQKAKPFYIRNGAKRQGEHQPIKNVSIDIKKTKELVKTAPICEELLRFNTTEEFNPLLEMLEYIGLYSLASWVKSYFYSHNCLSCKIGNCIVQGSR